MRNPAFRNPEFSSRDPKSRWRLEFNFEFYDNESGIQYLEPGIHSVHSCYTVWLALLVKYIAITFSRSWLVLFVFHSVDLLKTDSGFLLIKTLNAMNTCKGSLVFFQVLLLRYNNSYMVFTVLCILLFCCTTPSVTLSLNEARSVAS